MDLDSICCKVYITGKRYSAILTYGSELLQEIREISNDSLSTLERRVTFIYMYNGQFPVKITAASMGLSGYLIDMDKSTKNEADQYKVYTRR